MNILIHESQGVYDLVLKHWVVNNWIGQYTKEITGGQTLREVEARRSKLITGYTKLAF